MKPGYLQVQIPTICSQLIVWNLLSLNHLPISLFQFSSIEPPLGDPLIYNRLLTYPFTLSFTRSFNHSFTQSLTHSLTRSLTYSRPFTHPITLSFTCTQTNTHSTHDFDHVKVLSLLYNYFLSHWMYNVIFMSFLYSYL